MPGLRAHTLTDMSEYSEYEVAVLRDGPADEASAGPHDLLARPL